MIIEDALPEGMTIIEGKNLMVTARQCKIPFGVARDRVTSANGNQRLETIGLVIRDEDEAAFMAALDKRAEKRKTNIK